MKSVMLPTTLAAKVSTPVTTEAAKSDPGRVGMLVPPGVGREVGALTFPGLGDFGAMGRGW